MALPQPIGGNQNFTEVANLAPQLPELNVADLTVANAVLMSGLTVSTIAGNPNLALTATGTITATAVGRVALASTGAGGDILLLPAAAGVGNLQFFSTAAGNNPTAAATATTINAAVVATDGGAAALAVLLPVLVAYGLINA